MSCNQQIITFVLEDTTPIKRSGSWFYCIGGLATRIFSRTDWMIQCVASTAWHLERFYGSLGMFLSNDQLKMPHLLNGAASASKIEAIGDICNLYKFQDVPSWRPWISSSGMQEAESFVVPGLEAGGAGVMFFGPWRLTFRADVALRSSNLSDFKRFRFFTM